MKSLCSLLILLSCVSAANAQSLVNSWTLAGGGLNPSTYGNTYRPATLLSDAGSSGNATIGMSGLTMGGLGSSAMGAYGGIYSFMQTTLSLTLQANNLLPGTNEVTFGFFGGGGDPVALSYSRNSLTLNYNPANTTITSNGFSAGQPVIVSTPIGNQTLTPYTWTWTNLASLGNSNSFSIAWTAPTQHAFLTDISLTQTVPEPSVYALLACGFLVAAYLRLKRRRAKAG